MMKEEIFGPILPVFGYDDLSTVIDLINSRPKPLTVYSFTEDCQVKNRIKKETSAGAFVNNDVAVHLINPELPFGGVGMSGSGRYHGKCGFDVCSNPKSVVDVKILDVYPMTQRFAPYTQQKASTLTFMMSKMGKLHPMMLIKGVFIILCLIVLLTQGKRILKGLPFDL